MNGHGGKRPGGGRPKAEAPDAVPIIASTARELLEAIVADKTQDIDRRVRAAAILMREGAGGKKEAKDKAAKETARGKFAPAATPRLVVNNATP
jgi:hypothetical protein